jgi:Xaa-Pro aminopeptidase
MSAPYPRFSDAEMQARRAALTQVMAEREVDFLVLYGANRSGPAVGWLTRWPVTREAYVIVQPGERDVLFVDFYNHVPNAERMATEADVRPCEGRGIEHPLALLHERGAGGRRIGVIGPLPWRAAGRLGKLAGRLISLDSDFTRLRLVKSEEELEWLRVGAELTEYDRHWNLPSTWTPMPTY